MVTVIEMLVSHGRFCGHNLAGMSALFIHRTHPASGVLSIPSGARYFAIELLGVLSRNEDGVKARIQRAL